MNRISLKYLTLLGLSITIITNACKKSNTSSPTTNDKTEVKEATDKLATKMAGVPSTGNEMEKILDTMYLSALNVYYWNSSLPKYTDFNPRQYYNAANDKLKNMNAVLSKIGQQATNPATNDFYDFDKTNQRLRYSNIDKGSDVTAQGSAIQNFNTLSFETPPSSDGSGEGFGLLFGGFLGFNDLTPIKYNNTIMCGVRIGIVYPGSEAEKTGFKRGDIVMAINDVDIDSYMNYNSSRTQLIGVKSDFVNFLTSAMQGNTMKLKIYKLADNSFTTNSITSKTYVSSPVIKYTVLEVDGKKAAYLALSSFQDIDKTKADIDKAFEYFEKQDVNIENFIFDIRYNGGGYVSSAKYILDKWAGNTQNNNVAFYEYYNNDLQSGAAKPFLKNFKTERGFTLADIDYSVSTNTEKFSNKGAGNLKNLKNFYFLTTEKTASSSELTINSMRPYANVTVIGETTYGKPVGFFPLNIGSYDVFFAMFESKNAKKEGDYYTGITPDYNRTDNANYDFGDKNEVYIKTALDLIAGKTVAKSEPRKATPEVSYERPRQLTQTPNYGIMRVKVEHLKRLN